MCGYACWMWKFKYSKHHQQQVQAKSGKKVIGFAQVGAESGWRTAETDSIKSIPTLDPNFDLKFSDGQQKQENQIKAIRSFIAQKVDIIALDPVVETGWDTVLKEAKDAKIPVVIVDRKVTVSDESLYKCFLGSDMVEEGKKAAQVVIDKFGKDAKLKYSRTSRNCWVNCNGWKTTRI